MLSRPAMKVGRPGTSERGVVEGVLDAPAHLTHGRVELEAEAEREREVRPHTPLFLHEGVELVEAQVDACVAARRERLEEAAGRARGGERRGFDEAVADFESARAD